jgi:flagellin-specific chaperone FliS
MTRDIYGYRAAMFDGQPGVHWLRQAWRALRHYARQAAEAIEAGDRLRQTDMIMRADQLLILLTGVLDTSEDAMLGARLQGIYGALQSALFRANSRNDAAELVGFEQAVEELARCMPAETKMSRVV